MTASITSRHFAMRGVLLGLASPLWRSTASAADLVISNWDGYMAPDAMDAFKAATGIAGEVVGPRHQRRDHGQARRLGRQGL